MQDIPVHVLYLVLAGSDARRRQVSGASTQNAETGHEVAGLSLCESLALGVLASTGRLVLLSRGL